MYVRIVNDELFNHRSAANKLVFLMGQSPIELVLLPPLFCEPNVTEPWEAAPSANLRSQAAVMMSTSVASPGSRTPRASSNFVTRAQRSPIPNPIPLPNSVILSKAFAFLSCGSSLGGRRFSRGLPILDLSWLRTACPFLAGLASSFLSCLRVHEMMFWQVYFERLLSCR